MNLRLLQTQFLTCYPLKAIGWTEDITTESTQQDIVAATVRNEVISKKPVSKSYLSAFMKLYMAKIEEFGGEIYDVTFEAYGDVLTLPESETSYKHYTVGDKIISLHETNQLVAEGTTGLRTWQASQYLAEYLLHNQELVKDKGVLELGCGLGFLGLTVCSACKCSSYILSDHHESVLRKAKLNVSENKDDLLCVPLVLDIDWETIHTSGLSEEQKISAQSSHILLAADVIFDTKLIPALTTTIKMLLSHMPEDSSAYIASTLRNEETYATFTNLLDKQNLSHVVIECTAPKLFLYDETSKVEIICMKYKLSSEQT